MATAIDKIASRFFSEQTVESTWFRAPVALSVGMISVVSFNFLAHAAAAGHKLPAYLISAVTASCAGFLILLGMGFFFNAWQKFNGTDKDLLVAEKKGNEG